MINKKQAIITLSILVGVILVTGIFTAYIVQKQLNAVDETTQQIFTGSNKNQATYTDLQGNKLALEDYLGEFMVVVSWASWSPFSATDLVVLNKLADKYRDENVKFIAINRKETKEQAQRFINTLPVLDSIVIAIDTEDLFYLSVGGYAMPESVIFNQKGEIIKHERGMVSVDIIKSTLNELLITD